jgi:hypothetical protein
MYLAKTRSNLDSRILFTLPRVAIPGAMELLHTCDPHELINVVSHTQGARLTSRLNSKESKTFLFFAAQPLSSAEEVSLNEQ